MQFGNEPARNEQPKHRREQSHLPKEDCEANKKNGEYSMYNITNGSALEAWMVDIVTGKFTDFSACLFGAYLFVNFHI